MAETNNTNTLSISDRYEQIFRKSGIENLVFVDVDQLDSPDDSINGATLQKMLLDQNPEAFSHFSKKAMEEASIRFKAKAPSVGPPQNGNNVCLIIQPPSTLSDTRAIAERFVGRSIMARVLDVPGEVVDYVEAYAKHEVKHCAIDTSNLGEETTLSFDEYALERLTFEVEADQNMVDFLRETGRPEVAQFLTDMRSLSSVLGYDREHGTSSFLAEGNERTPTMADVNALQDVKETIFNDINNVLNPSASPDDFGDINDLVDKFGEERTLATLDQLVDQGKYNDRPEMKAYIQNFSDAYRRQFRGENIPIRTANQTASTSEFEQARNESSPSSTIDPTRNFTNAAQVIDSEHLNVAAQVTPETVFEKTV